MLTRFGQAETGAVAVMLVILLPVLLTFAGVAVDLTGANRMKSKLDVLADAAALAAVSNAAMLSTDSNAQIARSQEVAVTTMRDSAAKAGLGFTSINAVATVDPDMTVTVRLSWESAYLVNFGRFLMGDRLRVSGMAESKSNGSQFVDLVAIVDASGSMGIGASAEDQEAMARTFKFSKDNDESCVFACHTIGKTALLPSTRTASGRPAQSRFDVVRSALTRIVSEAEKIRGEKIRLTVFTVSNRPRLDITPTTNLGQARQTLSQLQMHVAGAGTNFYASLPQIAAQLPSRGGKGMSPNDRKLYVMLFTDGVEDDVYEKPNRQGVYEGDYDLDPNFRKRQPSHTTKETVQGFDGSYCRAFPESANIMTLTTDYVIPSETSDERFIFIRDKLRGSIRQNMARCATDPDFVFTASSGEDIQKAIDMMYKKITAGARLSR